MTEQLSSGSRVRRISHPDQVGEVTGLVDHDGPRAYVLWESGINAGVQTMIGIDALEVVSPEPVVSGWQEGMRVRYTHSFLGSVLATVVKVTAKRVTIDPDAEDLSARSMTRDQAAVRLSPVSPCGGPDDPCEDTEGCEMCAEGLSAEPVVQTSAFSVIANPGKAGGFLVMDGETPIGGGPHTTRASANRVMRECQARRDALQARSELPYVSNLSIIDGLPSLTMHLDGKGVSSGVTLAVVEHLKRRGVLPAKRITLSLGSGSGLRLCPDDLRQPGPALDAVTRAISDRCQKAAEADAAFPMVTRGAPVTTPLAEEIRRQADEQDARLGGPSIGTRLDREIAGRLEGSDIGEAHESEVTPENLNDRMEFDHVVEVFHDGSVIDRDDLHAPEVYADENAGINFAGAEGWVALDGYSGQDRYSGPIMHESEYIGGRMAQDILSEPGVYVAVVVYDLETATEEETPTCGWAVLRRDPSSDDAIADATDIVMGDVAGFMGDDWRCGRCDEPVHGGGKVHPVCATLGYPILQEAHDVIGDLVEEMACEADDGETETIRHAEDVQARIRARMEASDAQPDRAITYEEAARAAARAIDLRQSNAHELVALRDSLAPDPDSAILPQVRDELVSAADRMASDEEPCEGCNGIGYIWPCATNCDDSHGWVERCDTCQRFETDDLAADAGGAMLDAQGAFYRRSEGTPIGIDGASPYIDISADTRAMDEIHDHLHQTIWDADTIAAVAAVVERTGRKIGSPDDAIDDDIDGAM